MQALFLLISLILLTHSANSAQDDDGLYRIGTGIGDITGPAAGDHTFYHNAMNNSNSKALTSGIHTRLYARSFIVQSLETGNCVVFVSCDLTMFDHGLKTEVIEKLKGIYGAENKYTQKNVQISVTHTLSSPAGYMQYYSFVSNYKFNAVLFWEIVDGIVASIQMAHNSLTDGHIFVHKGDLPDYSENGDPETYSENEDADSEEYPSNVDTEMISLKFETVDEVPIGSFNWWPVHPMSFNAEDNPLISSDSTGYASVKFDYQMNTGDGARPGRGNFVAAFSTSNFGDVIPKIPQRSNLTERLEKVAILGEAQFQKAFELFNDKTNLIPVKGPIDFRQKYVDFTGLQVPNPEEPGKTKKLCKAALGYSFYGLNQTDLDPMWKLIMLLHWSPSLGIIACQEPKPVAFALGEWFSPFAYAPNKVDLNILRLGSVEIVSSPGELSTMAGRRLKKAMKELLPDDHEVIISGLANNYINSITTTEEYSKEPQSYAGSATLYGKYTLNGIIESQKDLMTKLISGGFENGGFAPTNLTARIEKLPERNKAPPPPVDQRPSWNGEKLEWGTVVTQPLKVLLPGQNLIVRFVSPRPKIDPVGGTHRSHFLIQLQNETSANGWTDVRTDADLDTTFQWNRSNRISGIHWLNIPKDVALGTYRVYHSGYFLEKEGETPTPFHSISETFQILETMPSTEEPTRPTTTAATDRTTTSSSDRTTTSSSDRTTTSSSTQNIVSKTIVILFAVIIIQLR